MTDLTADRIATRCEASVRGREYGVLSHLPHRCTAPSKTTATLRRYGDDDIEGRVCGTHARVARTTGRVYRWN